MKTMQVIVDSDNISSPLGDTTSANMAALQRGESGVRLHRDTTRCADDFFAALFPENAQVFENAPGPGFTKFESLLLASIKNALATSRVKITDPRTLFVVSTTKGNIALLESEPSYSPSLAGRISLAGSAEKIAAFFKHPNQPVVISNACISGTSALLFARRMILSGRYDHAIVSGADLITRFVLAGFESFLALSPEPCRPFDRRRKGINLGEAAATVVLTKKEAAPGDIAISGGAVSNDANHISGPSRTGEELAIAIRKALDNASVSPSSVDFISAHGTATQYNDDMEARAFALAGLSPVPANSLKGYFGHTLGAAGLVESIVSIHSMKGNVMIPTLGFQEPGVPVEMNICDRLQQAEVNHCLKTASGFGGCNAALVFSKNTAP